MSGGFALNSQGFCIEESWCMGVLGLLVKTVVLLGVGPLRRSCMALYESEVRKWALPFDYLSVPLFVLVTLIGSVLPCKLVVLTISLNILFSATWSFP